METIETFNLVPVAPPVLERAAEPFPTMLGSLDAIHLASALLVQDRFEDRGSLVCDARPGACGRGEGGRLPRARVTRGSGERCAERLQVAVEDVVRHVRWIVSEPGDLPENLTREMGSMLARVERAVRSVGEIGRVHVCRWGDGSEHLHWWFMARPARLPQLIGSFAAIWDDILPPTPDDVWQANLDLVRRAMTE